jgi:hypothetical protein
VVAGADAHTYAAGQLGDVVGVDALDSERRQAAPALGLSGTDDAQAGDLGEAVEHVGGERLLVSAYAVHVQRGQVVHGRAQAGGLGDRGGASLELVRELVPGGSLEVDRGDHVSARHERLHLLEDLGAAVQHADAGGPERLVARPGVEVRSDRLHVHRHVRHSLGAVHERQRAGGADARGHLRDGRDRAEHVGDV